MGSSSASRRPEHTGSLYPGGIDDDVASLTTDHDGYTYADGDDYLYPSANRIQPTTRWGQSSHAPRLTDRAGYAASSPVPRALSSRSSNPSSYASTVFSRAQTRASVSSQPPRRPDITNFNHALAAAVAADLAPINDIPAAAPTPNAQQLWCEFCVLSNCNATFRLDHTREWIDHHRSHLRDRYPAELQCWFCDHVTFVARGHTNNERRGNFTARMEHIRGHIMDDYMVQAHYRPDFWMVTHLAGRGLIDEATARHAMAYSELPDELRLPGSSASGNAQSYQPERRPAGPGLAYDLDRERRLQRPRGGQRPRHAPTHH